MNTPQMEEALRRARGGLKTVDEVTDDIAHLLLQELSRHGVPLGLDYVQRLAASVVHGPARHLHALGVDKALNAVESTCSDHQRREIAPAMCTAATGDDPTVMERLGQLQQRAAGLQAARRSVSALLVAEVPLGPVAELRELLRTGR